MRVSHTTLAASFALALLAGCSSSSSSRASSSTAASADAGTTGSSSAASSSDPQSFCSDVCTRQAACDSTIDVDTCSATCGDNLGGLLPKLRSDFVGDVTSCYDGADCRSILTTDQLSGCLDEAAASISPSDATKSFCDVLTGAFTHCDMSFDLASCLDETKIYADDTVGKAKDCPNKPCDVIASCVDSVLDIPPSN
jgi:hypothetical protein